MNAHAPCIKKRTILIHTDVNHTTKCSQRPAASFIDYYKLCLECFSQSTLSHAPWGFRGLMATQDNTTQPHEALLFQSKHTHWHTAMQDQTDGMFVSTETHTYQHTMEHTNTLNSAEMQVASDANICLFLKTTNRRPGQQRTEESSASRYRLSLLAWSPTRNLCIRLKYTSD